MSSTNEKACSNPVAAVNSRGSVSHERAVC